MFFSHRALSFRSVSIFGGSSPFCFLSLPLPVFRDPLCTPFKPHLLCSIITHHMQYSNMAVTHTDTLRLSFCSLSLISSSLPLSFLLSCPLSSFCHPLPFSPTSSLPSLPLTHSISSSVPICAHRKSETSSVFL